MNTPSIIVLITTLLSAPILTAVLSWIRDRKKDKATEEQISVSTMKEVIAELRLEVARLHGYIKDLETELKELKDKFRHK